MLNNINEVIYFINNNGNSEGNLKNFVDKHYENFEEIEFNFIETLEIDEHRWYILSTNVYEVYKNDMLLGNLAINEVTTIKSETSSYKDLFIAIKAYAVKKVIKESFELLESEE